MTEVQVAAAVVAEVVEEVVAVVLVRHQAHATTELAKWVGVHATRNSPSKHQASLAAQRVKRELRDAWRAQRWTAFLKSGTKAANQLQHLQ